MSRSGHFLWPRGKFLCPERGIRTRQCPDRGTKSLVVIKVLKLIINDHYHKGKGSKIVNHKICKVRVPKEENRQRVRGVSKGTKANEENKEEVCENEESVQKSDEEDEVDPFSIEEKRKIICKTRSPISSIFKT